MARAEAHAVSDERPTVLAAAVVVAAIVLAAACLEIDHRLAGSPIEAGSGPSPSPCDLASPLPCLRAADGTGRNLTPPSGGGPITAIPGGTEWTGAPALAEATFHASAHSVLTRSIVVSGPSHLGILPGATACPLLSELVTDVFLSSAVAAGPHLPSAWNATDPGPAPLTLSALPLDRTGTVGDLSPDATLTLPIVDTGAVNETATVTTAVGLVG